MCLRSLLHSSRTLNLQHLVRDRCARDRSSSRSISSSNTMADSARDAQSVDDRLINLEVNLATLYRLLNLDVVPSAAFSSEADKQALWDLLDELASRVISWDLPQVGNGRSRRLQTFRSCRLGTAGTARPKGRSLSSGRPRCCSTSIWRAKSQIPMTRP